MLSSVDEQELVAPEQHLSVLLPQDRRLGDREELSGQGRLDLLRGPTVEQQGRPLHPPFEAVRRFEGESPRQRARLLLQERTVEREQLLQRRRGRNAAAAV